MRGRAACLGVALAIWIAPAEAAQSNIGATELVKNDVSREIGGAGGKLATGDPVYRNEIVKTGQESAAKLVFLDSTNLAVGAISRVVLDRFVYDGGEGGQTVAVKLTKGLFRFTTGALDKKAYSVTTPTAAIGVRGTVLDISVSNATTRVTLREGKAIVCPVERGSAFEQLARDCARGRGGGNCHCTSLDHVGQTVQATRGASGTVTTTRVTAPVSVASLCSGGFCSATSYASLTDTLTKIASDFDFAGPVDTNGPTDGGGGAALCGR